MSGCVGAHIWGAPAQTIGIGSARRPGTIPESARNGDPLSSGRTTGTARHKVSALFGRASLSVARGSLGFQVRILLHRVGSDALHSRRFDLMNSSE